MQNSFLGTNLQFVKLCFFYTDFIDRFLALSCNCSWNVLRSCTEMCTHFKSNSSSRRALKLYSTTYRLFGNSLCGFWEIKIKTKTNDYDPCKPTFVCIIHLVHWLHRLQTVWGLDPGDTIMITYNCTKILETSIRIA